MLANQSYPSSVIENRMTALNKQPSAAGSSSRPLKLCGDFCVDTFLESYRWLADRHPILNMKYELDMETGAYVKVLDSPAVISVQDHSAMDEVFVNQKLIELSRADFDVHQDHLFMLHLIKCDENAFILYVKSHHVFSDGLTCLKILLNTLEAYHSHKTTGSFSSKASECSPPHYIRFIEEFTLTQKHLN